MGKSKFVFRNKLCTVGILTVAVVGGVSLPLTASLATAQEVQAATDVEINATNFPDENFRKYVLDEVDKDKNGKLSESELEEHTYVYCPRQSIVNLKGIEYFKNLQYLSCSGNLIKSLNISKNTFLKYLDCSDNNLTNIDLSKNTLLETVNLHDNNLNSIHIGQNNVLKTLLCANNKLIDLDISGAPSIEEVGCWDNKIKKINTSNNKSLKELSCSRNDIDTLYLSNNTNLVSLSCDENNIKFLDLNNNTNLTYLSCHSNAIEKLNVSKITFLKTLYCYENKLTSLDLSKNTYLKDVYCSYQDRDFSSINREIPLKSLDVSINPSRIINLYGAIISNGKFSNIGIKDAYIITDNVVDKSVITYSYETGFENTTMFVVLTDNTVYIIDVELDRTVSDMTTGETLQLLATVIPSNATNKNVVWSSSNTAVATVDGSGKVTAKGAGTAKITVKTKDGSKTATCTVTVKNKTVNVTGVQLNKTTAEVITGDNLQLTATVSPSNATDQSVTWTSSNASVATVDGSGKVTAKGAGTAKITVKTKDGGKTATCTVTVKNKIVNVTGVKLDKASANITKSNTLKLTATVSPVNASNKAVTWSSSNKNVATVDANGNVKAVNPGTATITVKTKDGGKTATCKITVPNVWKRLWGQGRYDTMKAIVNEGFKGTGGTVIVATGSNFKDALAASGLAGLENAPVVLTDGNTLSGQAKDVLNRIKPKKIYVAGGPAAVSDKVVSAIRSVTKVAPQRLYGQNSAETSAMLALAGKGKWKDATAIIATNKSFKDALSVAPIAYVKKYPVLLADNGTSLSKPVLNALKTLGVKNVIIVGGKAAVTANVEKQITSAGMKIKTRLWGNNAVETSKKIAEWGIKNGMSANKMGVATSQNFPDALAGAAMCGKNGSVLVLADDNANLNATFPKAYKTKVNQGYVFGGEAAVGKKTMTTLENSVK